MPALPLRARRRLLAVPALLFAAGTFLAMPPAAHADEPTKVLLLLDVSGSMNDKISSGGTKFAAAKRALKEVAGTLPAGTQVGLRVYGSTIAEPKSVNPKACTDTQLVMPIAPLDQARMDQAVDSFTAKGETPIAYSLQQSVNDLGDSGRRVLVLISDGQETCTSDPCPTARKLAASGVDLQFNAIGLDVNRTARRQLQCIVDAGDGSYYDASKASELSQAIRKITTRAVRPFQMSGAPVKGTLDEGSAPPLSAGQYLDRYDPTGTSRYYRINRTPGSTVTASIASTVQPWHGQTLDSWNLELSTASGQRCDSASTGEQTFHSVTVVSGAVRSSSPDLATSRSGPQACGTDPLVLGLSRRSLLGDKRSVPVEVLISEEPPITNLATLPPAVASFDGHGRSVPNSKPVRPVVGGTSFSNAQLVTPGSWSDSVTVGETVLYRVRVETGQRLRATVTVPPGDLAAGETVVPILKLLAPSRVQLTRQYGVLTGGRPLTLTASSPQVRVRNREAAFAADTSGAIGATSVAGDYYIAVQLDPGQATVAGRVLPVRLNVAVDGQPTGQPEYAAVRASASATPSLSGTPGGASTTVGAPAAPSTGSGAGGRAALVGFGVVVLGAVAAGGWLLGRRSRPRNRASDERHAPVTKS